MNETFGSYVEKAFNFLQRAHGFRIVNNTSTMVVYESSLCRVALIYDDQRSFEVGFELGQPSECGQPAYNFEEILRSEKVPTSEWLAGYAAPSLMGARDIVFRMAIITHSFATRLLEGDADAWERLAAQRRADCIGYANTVKLDSAKRQASIAWSARDYAEVVKVLWEVRALLGKTERKKLAFAIRATTRNKS